MMVHSFAIPCRPFNLQLSRWDKRVMPMYSKRILCFPLPGNDKQHNDRIAHLLLAALRSTVEELPFLAGSVVPFSKDQPWLRDLRPYGAAYLEVNDISQEISFLDLRKSRFSPSLLNTEKLCPFPAAVYLQDDPLNVCRLRANFVDGGLLLVVSIIHTVCDGRGITEVLKIFADKLRKAQTDDYTTISTDRNEVPKQIYLSDRTSVVCGNGLLGAIDNHPAWTAAPLTSHKGFVGAKTVCTTFHISSDSLRAVKQIASSSPSSSPSAFAVISISTHDAIAALIWRSVIVARYRAGILSDHSTAHFCQAIDCRTRLHLPEPYFGNVIYGIKASFALPSLAPEIDSSDALRILGLQAVASAIRVEVNGATGEKFRDLLGFVERTDMEMLTRLSVVEDLTIGSMLLVSYFGFEMHELDYGEALGGKIEAFRLPSRGLAPGMPVILPRLPDGSCEFVINEREEVMKFFAEDEILRRFASKEC